MEKDEKSRKGSKSAQTNCWAVLAQNYKLKESL